MCFEPGLGSSDVEVVLQAGGVRDLLFSRTITSSSGQVLGKEIAGVQSSVQCTLARPSVESTGCVPAVGRPIPLCSDVDAHVCGCEANTSSLPALAYQRQMLQESVAFCDTQAAAGQQVRVLVIGLGGGAMPMYLRRHCAACSLESVEVDARVARIAEHLLGFKSEARSELEVADGLAAVQRRAKSVSGGRSRPYGLVLVDCFAGEGIPDSCSSESFAQGLRDLLSPDGLVLQNAGRADVSALLAAYRAAFGDGRANTSDVAESSGHRILRAAANL